MAWAREGFGVKPSPLSLIFYKTLLPAQRGLLFSHTFCLLICWLSANTMEWKLMQISRNIANGPKSNNQISEGISVIVCVQKPPHHFLQTFRALRMFKIVLRGSSLYPKQLPLFCLLRLICTSADAIGYISNFYSMIKLLHELKNRSC